METAWPLRKATDAVTADLSTETVVPGAPAPSHWGHLKIIEQIGQGGYGEVYRAHDSNLECEVALKLLRPDRDHHETDVKSFLDEARRLARVRHPNVLVVHGADRHDGRVGLWTDLLRGKTLEQSIEQQGPFGADEATLVGVDLCRALAAVHAAGLVHRDVKTSNVMREEGGRIVLMDFNSVTERPALHGRSESDSLSGTPLFMAPEVLRGEDSGTASDIYSLGVVLYRLVSGLYPVSAKSLSELREKHRRGESARLRDVRPDLPAAFVEVVERALGHEPDRRYSTVGEMERALRSSLGTVPQVYRPERVPWWRRPAFGISVAGSLLAAAIGAVLIPGLWPGPFQVEAALYRLGQGTEERLLPGGRLAPGDRLFLEIEGSTEMHVYVLNEDEVGDPFVLFPLPLFDKKNPLPAGSVHRLPGSLAGTGKYWEVTSAGRRETFLVIASQDPLVEMEREITTFLPAGSVSLADLERQAENQALRGTGGLVEGEPSGPGT